MKLLAKHEIKYIHSLAKSEFRLTRQNSNRDPKDIIKVWSTEDSIEIKYAGFYSENTAKQTFYNGENYVLFDPQIYKVREGFYSVGWEYQAV